MTDPCQSCGEPVRVERQVAVGGVIEVWACVNPICETNASSDDDTAPWP